MASARSNFLFVRDDVLQENLDIAFNHILELLPLSAAPEYTDIAKSSFRKTIIIYTASIIEALLFHIVDTELNDQDLEVSTWELSKKEVLYEVSATHKIVAGDYKVKVTKTKKDKLNLAGMCELLKNKGILTDPLLKKIDSIRELRNSQHIGPHKKVRSFSSQDLEDAFSVARDVKGFVKARTSRRTKGN